MSLSQNYNVLDSPVYRDFVRSTFQLEVWIISETDPITKKGFSCPGSRQCNLSIYPCDVEISVVPGTRA